MHVELAKMRGTMKQKDLVREGETLGSRRDGSGLECLDRIGDQHNPKQGEKKNWGGKGKSQKRKIMKEGSPEVAKIS